MGYRVYSRPEKGQGATFEKRAFKGVVFLFEKGSGAHCQTKKKVMKFNNRLFIRHK